MRILSRTSPKIFSGAGKVMQRTLPPQRQAQRSQPGKEIAFIAESKKLAEAKQGAKVKEEKLQTTLNDIVAEVKDSGKSGGEAGYILLSKFNTAFAADIEAIKHEVSDQYPGGKNRIKRADATNAAINDYKAKQLNTLSSSMRSWYDNQVADYRSVMDECNARYKEGLAKLKDRYEDDPVSYRKAEQALKVSIFPKWSVDYQAIVKKQTEKAKATEKAAAYAKVRAKTAGVSLSDLTDKQISDLKNAKREDAIEKGKELGLDVDQLIAIRAVPKNERSIFKIEFDTSKPLPKGATVGEGGIVIEPETVTQPVVTIPATAEELEGIENAKAKGMCEGAMKTYYTIKPYTVTTTNGDKLLVQALDDKGAREKAEAAGYKVAYVGRKILKGELQGKVTTTGAYNVTLADGSKVTMVPYTDANTGDTLLLPKDAVTQLKETTAYAEAKGTNEQKLGVAYAAMQHQFNDWLDLLKKEQPDLYKVYENQGYEGLSAAIAKQHQDFVNNLKEQAPGIYEAYTKGWMTLDQVNQAIKLQNKNYEEYQAQLMGLEKGFLSRSKEGQDLIVRLALTPEPQRSTVLKESEKGNEASWLVNKTYSELTNEEKLQVLGYYATNIEPGVLAVTKEYLRQRVEPLIALTPVLGTIYYWNQMSPAWKAASIATDILCVGAIIHAAAAAARGARGYTAISRMKAGLRGASEMTIAEIAAPGDVIVHPIATAKGIGKQIQSIVETLVHPKKIPLGSAELTFSTTRLPTSDVGDSVKAMQLRDMAVEAAINGKKATATVGDVTLTLNPTELQKVGGAMAIHDTPDIRPFLNGATVGSNAAGDLFISPNLHSRFAMATSIGEIPEGGIKGALIIRDESVLKALAPSGKLYKAKGLPLVAEIEARLPKGTVLPAPSQVLVTRDIAGNKLTLLVIGKPFTQMQIAKLKFLGSLDTVGQIFKPTMTLTGAEKTAISDMDELIDLAKRRSAPRGKVPVTPDMIDSVTRRINEVREPIRPGDIIWAEYADKGLLERWRELNPGAIKTEARGVKLPDIDARQAISRRAAITSEARRVPVAERRGIARERITPTGERRIMPGERQRVTLEQRRISRAIRAVPPYTPAYVPPRATTRTATKLPSRLPPGRTPFRITRSAPMKAPPKMTIERVPGKLGRGTLPKRETNLVSWRQGAYFITIVSPFRSTGTKPDVIYSRHKPPWAKEIRGRKSPQRSFIGLGSGHPNTISLPMGRTRAIVLKGSRLRFQGVVRGRRRGRR